MRIDHAILRKLERLAPGTSETLLMTMLKLKRLVQLLTESRHVRGSIEVCGRLQLTRVPWVPAGCRWVKGHLGPGPGPSARSRRRVSAVAPLAIRTKQAPPFQEVSTERRAVTDLSIRLLGRRRVRQEEHELCC